MYVICDSMETLSNAFWIRSSYVDALKFYFSRFDSKEVIVFRDVRGKGRCDDLQFISLVKKKNFEKILNSY